MTEATQAPAPSALQSGGALYRQYCAPCHGDEGGGNGRLASLLAPRPRNLRRGRFQLVSTQNGAPTEEDLLDTLRRGVTGSAMPGWDWMPEEDLRHLVAFVRNLALEGRTDELLASAWKEGRELAPSEALALARQQLEPGPIVDAGQPVAVDAELLAEGRTLYEQRCAACHGPDGTGSSAGRYFTDEGELTRPRDFTSGLLKGGISEVELVWRMLAGMPGTPMAATRFEAPGDARAVAAYVRSLIDKERWERSAQTRRQVRARRVDGELPRTADDPAWEEAPETWLPLMTLWWRPDRIEGVRVRALHDRRDIAFLVTWEDPVQDAELLGDSSFPDGFAVSFTQEPAPPLFAMGTREHPVSIWHWKAAWFRSIAGALDLLDWKTVPHRGGVPDAGTPLNEDVRYRPDEAGLEAAADATERLHAEGAGRIAASAPSEAGFRVQGTWEDGRWQLLATRPMIPEGNGADSLLPSSTVSMAVAVWDGAAEDTGGRKAVSIWHTLRIE